MAAEQAGSETGSGRVAQRRRTRKWIVDAAIALISRGGTPSMAEVAAQAEVSRRTLYLYFPTLEHLLIDATLGLLGSDSVEKALAEADEGDVYARVDKMVTALVRASIDSLDTGRRLLRLTVETPPPANDPSAPKRGYRRVRWIESALAPIKDRLTPAAFEDLVSQLAMVVGWEALIVLSDLRGLQPADATRVSVNAAHALIRGALEVAAK